MSEVLENSDSCRQPCFTLKNRVLRSLWEVVYLALFRFSWRPLHRWRSFLLRCFGARIGHGCHIYPRVRIWAPWNLICADHVGIADDVIVYNQAPITIHRQAVISQGAHLCAGSHDYQRANFPIVVRPITIGAQAWICAEAFITLGTTIGEGAVVGARSVVTRDMPPWMVCVGHPCRPIKPRVIQL